MSQLSAERRRLNRALVSNEITDAQAQRLAIRLYGRYPEGAALLYDPEAVRREAFAIPTAAQLDPQVDARTGYHQHRRRPWQL